MYYIVWVTSYLNNLKPRTKSHKKNHQSRVPIEPAFPIENKAIKKSNPYSSGDF